MQRAGMRVLDRFTAVPLYFVYAWGNVKVL
jgi:hypothetical protein